MNWTLGKGEFSGLSWGGGVERGITRESTRSVQLLLHKELTEGDT